MNLKTLVNVPVSVLILQKMNTITGLILSEEATYTDDDNELLSFIKEDIQPVVSVCKLPKKHNATRTPVLVTFAASSLPDKVKIGWESCPVKPLTPRPQQCGFCLHIKRQSRQPV